MRLPSKDATRRAVLRLVAEHPGAHLRELERLAPVSFGSLRHHLDRFERQGLVRSELDLRFKRYYVANLPPLPRRTAAVLRQPQLRRILAALLESPGRRHGEIADALAIPRPSLTTYLRRLVAVGLVAVEADGRYRVTRPDMVRTAMAARPAGALDQLIDDALRMLEGTDSP